MFVSNISTFITDRTAPVMPTRTASETQHELSAERILRNSQRAWLSYFLASASLEIV